MNRHSPNVFWLRLAGSDVCTLPGARPDRQIQNMGRLTGCLSRSGFLLRALVARSGRFSCPLTSYHTEHGVYGYMPQGNKERSTGKKLSLSRSLTLHASRFTQAMPMAHGPWPWHLACRLQTLSLRRCSHASCHAVHYGTNNRLVFMTHPGIRPQVMVMR